MSFSIAKKQIFDSKYLFFSYAYTIMGISKFLPFLGRNENTHVQPSKKHLSPGGDPHRLKPQSEELNMSRVIAIVNEKGGVGKTTTTVNLAAALVRKRKKVLCIDMDPQSSMGIALGFRCNDKGNTVPTIYDLFHQIQEEDEVQISIDQYIQKHKEGIHIIPSKRDLATFDMPSSTNAMSFHYLHEALQHIRSKYDFILIDCRPSLGNLTLNALVAADSVIIPAQPQHLSAEGVGQVIRTILDVKKYQNEKLVIDGILFTMVDKRTYYSRTVMSSLEDTFSKQYGIRFYKTTIPRSVRVEEVSNTATSLFLYDPNGKSTQAYASLAKEVISNG